MKKRNRILSLLLITALFFGLLTVFPMNNLVSRAESVDVESNASDTEGAGNGQFSPILNPDSETAVHAVAANPTVDNYTVTQDPTMMADYLVTDPASGNQYIEIRKGAEFNPEMTGYYVNFNAPKQRIDYVLGTAVVISVDVFFESLPISDMYMQIISYDSDGNWGNNREGTIYQFNTAHISSRVKAGQWNRITIIGQVKEDGSNATYIFINGQTAWQSRSNGVAKGTIGDGWYFRCFRFGQWSLKNTTDEMGIAIDNVYVDVNCIDEWVMKVNGDTTNFDGWVDAPMHPFSPVPALAVVGDNYVYSLDELNSALVGKTYTEVELLRNPAKQIVVNRPCTIRTNGIATPVAGTGHILTDNGDGSFTSVADEREGRLTVNINGEEKISKMLRYGTDVAEYLRLNNGYVADCLIADNGEVYTDVSWDSPAEVVISSEEYTFNITATRLEDDYIVLDGTNAVQTASLDEALSMTGNHTVIVNSDITLAAKVDMASAGDKTVYLAGHTLSFPASGGGDHGLQIGQNTGSLTILGGRIVDDVRNTTTSTFFLNYGYKNEVKLYDVDLYAVSRVGIVREGTMTVENSELEILEMQETVAFLVDEGYTTTKCTLNLIDSKIKFNHFSGQSSSAFIDVQNNNNRLLPHEVNISGCEIYIDFNSCLVRAVNPAAFINIDNSKLNVKVLLNYSTTATLNIGKNVVSATPLDGISQAVFDNGVQLVNSGVPGAPYAYTDEYATVTWSNGETEYWLDGSYPSNPDCKRDGVTMVEAGQKYSFTPTAYDLNMRMNFSLGEKLTLNLYIPTAVPIKCVTIDGMIYYPEQREFSNGTPCHYIECPFVPYRGAEIYTAVVEFLDGTRVTRELSFVEYSTLAQREYQDNEEVIALIKAIADYIATSHEKAGAYAYGYAEVKSLAERGAVGIGGAVNTASSLNSYITSASLDLDVSPRWVFRIAEGADIEGLTVKVGGSAVAYKVEGDRIILTLPARRMLDTITISVGGIEGEYNFASYYDYISAQYNSFTFTSGKKAGVNIAGAEAYYCMDLLNSFLSYISCAYAYGE